MQLFNSQGIPLTRAFRLTDDVQAAIVGATDKISVLFQLASEFHKRKDHVFITTTASLTANQVRYATQHIPLSNTQAPIPQLTRLKNGIYCLTGFWDQAANLWRGPSLSQLEQLSKIAHSLNIPLLIIADRPSHLSLAIPDADEPIIPPFVEVVIVVANLSALNQPLNSEWTNNPHLFTTLSGLNAGESISAEAFATYLTHPQGGCKNIPPYSKKVCILTESNILAPWDENKHFIQMLTDSFASVVISSPQADIHRRPLPDYSEDNSNSDSASIQSLRLIAVHEAVAGVVLAAGSSQRFGKPKQLLQWKGETLVHRSARIALDAGLKPVYVISGAFAASIKKEVENLPVQIIENQNWQEGQSSSVKAAIQALPAHIGSVIFILTDQPFISVQLLHEIIEHHSHTLASIIAPKINDQRSNPVLFDQITFPDLLKLEGDIGGRALFSRYPPSWVAWHDARLLIDIDTPEAYQRLLKLD